MSELLNLIAGHIPALLLLLMGYVLLIVEMFIPGFGVAGCTGLLLAGVGILLMGPTAMQATILVAFSALFLGAVLLLVMRGFKKGSFKRVGMILTDQVNAVETEALSKVNVGDTLEALTDLRPSGIAILGDERLDVVTEGEFIPAKAKLVVKSANGNKTVVKQID